MYKKTNDKRKQQQKDDERKKINAKHKDEKQKPRKGINKARRRAAGLK